MSKEKDKCVGQGDNHFKRARYFHGMLLSERDFKEEQVYHNEKRKLLNRMLHGWGVVCGLKLIPADPPGTRIVIQPGLALDCSGNEIYLDKSYQLELEAFIRDCVLSDAPGSAQTQEQKCSENGNSVNGEKKWFVVIRYAEIPTDPVPVYATGGGCEEKQCDYSRTREGFCIDLVREVDCDNGHDSPGQYQTQSQQQVQTQRQGGGSTGENGGTGNDCEGRQHRCPGNCCDDAWVVLGSITFNGKSNITGDMIDGCECRRFV
ncbi:MAG: hypothetical protein GY950_07755 [bacterium]|nr:hypothetical protein [bacterium]